MRRKAVTGLMIICLFLSAFTYPVEKNNISPNLCFNGNTASCSVVIKAPGKQISATMELWHGSTLVGYPNHEGVSTRYYPFADIAGYGIINYCYYGHHWVNQGSYYRCSLCGILSNESPQNVGGEGE